MSIAINKTKSLVVAKQPRRCKLAVNDEIVDRTGDVLQILRGRNNRPSIQEI